MEGLEPAAFDAVLAGLRILVGLTFAAHGWAKRFSGGGLDGTAGWFDSIGMKPGRLHAQLASTTEMATGAMLALGLLTSFAAAGMIGVMGRTKPALGSVLPPCSRELCTTSARYADSSGCSSPQPPVER